MDLNAEYSMSKLYGFRVFQKIIVNFVLVELELYNKKVQFDWFWKQQTLDVKQPIFWTGEGFYDNLLNIFKL